MHNIVKSHKHNLCANNIFGNQKTTLNTTSQFKLKRPKCQSAENVMSIIMKEEKREWVMCEVFNNSIQ